MKVCVIQPPYSRDVTLSDEFFAYKMKMLDECDASLDLIVLPEYSDVPCATETREDTLFYHEKYFSALMEKCVQTAKRCNAMVFVNALDLVDGDYRNTTYALNRQGELAGKYYKKHIPSGELPKVASDYTHEYSEPYVLEMEGLRFGFMTCYDFYFYEAFPAIARQNVDIIIGCSHQRSDTHDAIEINCRFLAYNTNAYVVRSSVSFSEDSHICGASMVVSPYGEVLCNMKGKFGKATAEFDPKDKYYKPAGYGNPDAAHYEYIEKGRMPWQYRLAGSAIVKPDKLMPYPRVCAHRGYSAIAPENTMPAFGAAVGMGAPEIEFDLWPTADGEIVSCHDRTLERVSNGQGDITEHTLAQLQELDFGVNFDEKFKGLRIVKFEDILKKFAGHIIMNIHVKPLQTDGTPYPEEAMKKIVALIRQYDAQNHVYFMITVPWIIKQFKDYAPDIPMCVGHWFKDPWGIVDRAIEMGCEKVQMIDPYYNQEMVDKAHAHGIICNFCIVEDVELAQKLMAMNFDTLLADDYLLVSQVVPQGTKKM